MAAFNRYLSSPGTALWILGVLLLLPLVTLSPFLVFPEWGLIYPYLMPDSFQWIGDGFYWAGYPIDPALRPPGLPMVLALFEAVGGLQFVPILQLLLSSGAAFLLALILNRVSSPWVSATIGLVVAWNFLFQNISLYILAESYAVFFSILSIWFLLRAKEHGGNYYGAALAAGISSLFSYASIFLVLALGLAVVLFRRRDLVRSSFWLATFLGALVGSSWHIYRWIVYGNPLYSKVLHVQLVQWHISSVGFYSFNLVGALGIPFFLLVLTGLFLLRRRHLKDETIFVILSWLVFSIIFWVFLYGWNDRRFLVYWYAGLAGLAAIALERLAAKSRVGAVALALAALWYSQLPYFPNANEASPTTCNEIALSPTWVLQTTTSTDRRGGPGIDLMTTTVVEELSPPTRSFGMSTIFAAYQRYLIPTRLNWVEKAEEIRRYLDSHRAKYPSFFSLDPSTFKYQNANNLMRRSLWQVKEVAEMRGRLIVVDGGLAPALAAQLDPIIVSDRLSLYRKKPIKNSGS